MANEKNLTPFKKGQSGNPKGRPKGQSLSTLLRNLLERQLTTKDPVTKRKIRKQIKEHINLRLTSKAIDGDIRAIEVIYDRLEGRAIQRNINADADSEDTDFIMQFFGMNGGLEKPHRKNGKKTPTLKKKVRI